MTGGPETRIREPQLIKREAGMRANLLIDTIVANAENTPGAVTVSSHRDNRSGARHLHLTGERRGEKFEIKYRDGGATQKGMGSPLTRDKSLHVNIGDDRVWAYIDTRLYVDTTPEGEVIRGVQRGLISSGGQENGAQKPLPSDEHKIPREDDYEKARKYLAPLLD
jgi:hypothetical protein